MIRKGEIRTLVDPENTRSKIKELDAKKIKVSSGRDVYFSKELFEKGFFLRVRREMLSYPKNEEQCFLHLKTREPNLKKMNVYNNWIIRIDDTETTIDLLKQLGYKEIFVELWDDCEEFEISGVKIDLFYLRGWDWLIEIESVIKTTKEQVYDKLLEILALFDLQEKDLIITEPAEYIFKKQFKSS